MAKNLATVILLVTRGKCTWMLSNHKVLFFDSEFKDLIPPCGLGTSSISITGNLVRNAESFLPTTAASESIV